MIEALKKAEYTGENRCLPCTATNLAIGVSVSAGVVWVGEIVDATVLGLGLGAVTFVGSLLSIYLHGYLVPGTPTLTRRYFPSWVLRVFGKVPPPTGSVDTAVSAEVDAIVSGDDALEREIRDDEDPRFGPAIREEWRDAVEDIEKIEDPASVVSTEGTVDTIAAMGPYRLYVDDRFVGKWRSETALVTHAASYAVLAGHIGDWNDRSPADQLRLLDRVRSHVGICPDCGIKTTRTTESVTGCCTTFEATVERCPECDSAFDIDRCPDCGHATEYVTESVETDSGPVEFGSLNCIDCEERIRSLPEFFTHPPRE
jgi:hypothetical protein